MEKHCQPFPFYLDIHLKYSTDEAQQEDMISALSSWSEAVILVKVSLQYLSKHKENMF